MKIETQLKKYTGQEIAGGELLLAEIENQLCYAVAVKYSSDEGLLLLSGKLAGETDDFGSVFSVYAGKCKLQVPSSSDAWAKTRPNDAVTLWTNGALWRFVAYPKSVGVAFDVVTGAVSNLPTGGWYVKDWRICAEDSDHVLVGPVKNAQTYNWL